jgi:hypothetical protein
MQRNPRGAQLAVLALAVLFLAIGAVQGNRLGHMREVERFYRWVVSASTSAMSGETLESEKAAGTEPLDDELFAEIQALAEQQLPDAIPVEDPDRNALGEARPKLVRAVRQERDREVYDLLASAQGQPLMEKYTGYLRENKLISVGTQFTADDMYGGEPQGVGLTSLFFGFRKLAANFLWLNVDTAWHAGQMHRMVPMMRTTVTLDPNFIDAYLLGGWHLAYNLTAKLPETPEPLKEFHPKYKRRLGVKEVWYYVAADFLKDGIRKNPREYKLYFDLGYAVYENKLNDHANAVRYLKEARRYKHDSWVPRMLYYSMWRNGQYDEALAGWQEYAQQFPQSTQALRFIPINAAYLAEAKSDQAAECAEAARIASADFTRQADELDAKGEAAGAADLRAKAAEANRVVAEMDTMSVQEWDKARTIFERMKQDSVASYRLQRRTALDLARDGRAREAVAYLDVARNQYLESFDEISDLIIDIKLKGGLPLLVTEKYAVERRREAAAYAQPDVPKPKRFVECVYLLPETSADALAGSSDAG